MNSWDSVPLKKLGEIVSGSTPSTLVKEYWDGDIPWITPADLTGHTGIYFLGELRKITQLGYKSCSTKMLPPGSILFSSRAPIGHCAITTYELCTNQGFKSIIPNEKLNPVYGYFALKYFTPMIVSKGRGATFSEINKELFGDFEIPLPSLPEQQRIAVILDKADHLRCLRRFALQLGDSYLQSVFLEMFGDPGKNPKDWEKKSLDKAILGTRNGVGRRDSISDSGVIVLRIREVGSGVIDYSSPRRINLSPDEIEKYKLEDNDLLLVRVNGNPDLVGRAALYTDIGETVAFNDHIIRVKIDQSLIVPIYLTQLLNSPYGRKELRENVTTTAGQYTINRTGLSRINVTYPPIKAQREFALLVQRFDLLHSQQREALRQSEHLFQSLLANAFEGEL